MKNFILLIVSTLLCFSCSSEDSDFEGEFRTREDLLAKEVIQISNQTSKSSYKVKICHKSAGEIVVDEASLSTHISHGDAVDMDGDGFFNKENGCSETDYDDSISFDQSILIDDDGDGFFTTANPFSAIDCDDNSYSEDNFCIDLKIGDIYQGGYIFYLDSSGRHGLVASLTDIPNGAPWGCQYINIEGTTSASFGEGRANTNAIVATSCQVSDEISSAAEACYSYSDGTYNDWFLPSHEELYLMWFNLANEENIGNFIITNRRASAYWSSTAIDDIYHTKAIMLSFSEGIQVLPLKGRNYVHNVRPVRAF